MNLDEKQIRINKNNEIIRKLKKQIEKLENENKYLKSSK